MDDGPGDWAEMSLGDRAGAGMTVQQNNVVHVHGDIMHEHNMTVMHNQVVQSAVQIAEQSVVQIAEARHEVVVNNFMQEASRKMDEQLESIRREAHDEVCKVNARLALAEQERANLEAAATAKVLSLQRQLAAEEGAAARLREEVEERKSQQRQAWLEAELQKRLAYERGRADATSTAAGSRRLSLIHI